MQAYMKSAMPYRGVSSPVLRRLCREAFTAHPLASADEWQRVVLELWRKAAFREERYAAVMLTESRRYREFLTFASVPMFEEMIVTGAWWDFVDPIASHSLGRHPARRAATHEAADAAMGERPGHVEAAQRDPLSARIQARDGSRRCSTTASSRT